MLERLFPPGTNADYRGHKLGIVLFGLLAFIKLLIGVRSMFDPAAVAERADGIPLGTFAPNAAHEVISEFALLGLNGATFAAVLLLVLWRYRSLIAPLLVIQLLARAGHWFVIARQPGAPANAGAPGDIVTWILLALTVTALGFSLRRKPDS